MMLSERVAQKLRTSHRPQDQIPSLLFYCIQEKEGENTDQRAFWVLFVLKKSTWLPPWRCAFGNTKLLEGDIRIGNRVKNSVSLLDCRNIAGFVYLNDYFDIFGNC